MKSKYINFQKILNIKFKNLDFLKKALTHKSYNPKENYEKLEFLGDRVLGLVISKKLLQLYPNQKEGILDKKLASMVNKNICYEVGKKLKLENFVLVGNSKKNQNKAHEKILADSIEALIGAIFLDKGLDIVEKFILKNWNKFILNSKELKIDSKTSLQEYSLKKYKLLPIYKLVSNTGPRHNPIFKVSVMLKDSKPIEGIGSSKKNAEQDAASKLLEKLNYELAR